MNVRKLNMNLRRQNVCARKQRKKLSECRLEPIMVEVKARGEFQLDHKEVLYTQLLHHLILNDLARRLMTLSVLCPSCGEGDDETRFWVQCDNNSWQTW